MKPVAEHTIVGEKILLILDVAVGPYIRIPAPHYR